MTPMVENSLKQMDADNWQEVGKQFVSANPMQRFGEPHEVAALVHLIDHRDVVGPVNLVSPDPCPRARSR